MPTATTHQSVGKAALLLLFPAVALLLQSANALLFHANALFILALVFPMTTLPSAALYIYRRYRLSASTVVKYALVSLVLVVLTSLLPLLFPSV